jgi:DNA-directed RNA polymerase subunit L
MNKENEIEKLKKEAKKYYLQYQNNDYSCGLLLADYMSKDRIDIKSNFNNAWKKLMELDPSCPKMEL